MLSSRIKHTLVLSLKDSRRRRDYISEHFRSIGISNYSFVEAVEARSAKVKEFYERKFVHAFPPCFRCGDIKCECKNNILIPQQVANWISFLSIWNSLSGRDDLFLICEDDVSFFNGGIRLLNDYLDNYSTQGQNVLIRLSQSGIDPNQDLGNVAQLKSSDEVVMSNVAYILNGNMASHLCNVFTKIATTSDIWLHREIANEQSVESVTLKPLIATDLSYNKDYALFASRIHPKGIDRDDEVRKSKHIMRANSEREYEEIWKDWFRGVN